MTEDSGFNLSVRELGLRTNGRARKPLTAVLNRPLTEQDILSLQEERQTQAPKIRKLRDRHHALARAIASGLSESDASILCGYDKSRVSILKGDPAFSELVTFYRGKVDEKYYGMHERMAGLGQDAVDELADRLEDGPEDFSINQLLELTKGMADRTGHGVSTKAEVNVKFGLAERLASARQRTEEALNPPVIIEGTVNS